MKENFSIREYSVDDKEEVLTLLRLNTPKYFAPAEEADFEHYLDQERELYYVLISEDKIVGCGGINFDDKKTVGKLSWDIMHPDYRGRNLGKLLVLYRLQKLTAIESVKTITVRTSQLAYEFYKKQGFDVLEVAKDFWAEGIDMYKMEFRRKAVLREFPKVKPGPAEGWDNWE
ncbi:GNAT family N-acetyltransferase [Desertivirga brevis]|uniref:GNAT family N-acetyltransferase n=1 Tax=Desertivirga brevis TaxID=2810310 RepID=UPI001A959309|nr:GNAT family N-acetyltransferase [Pedobacter sp. SYSU D00873]